MVLWNMIIIIISVIRRPVASLTFHHIPSHWCSGITQQLTWTRFKYISLICLPCTYTTFSNNLVISNIHNSFTFIFVYNNNNNNNNKSSFLDATCATNVQLIVLNGNTNVALTSLRKPRNKLSLDRILWDATRSRKFWNTYKKRVSRMSSSKLSADIIFSYLFHNLLNTRVSAEQKCPHDSDNCSLKQYNYC